jgi:hypothetical protein
LREGILLPTAQTVRVDAALQVGDRSESVTVTEQAPLLKTESGELSHNVETATLDDLPILQIGVSSTGLRDIYAMLQIVPGTTFIADGAIRINGMPSNTQQFNIEGQSANTGLFYIQSWVQPSVDSVQEVAIQTSNYAAEFGQAGGGFFNVTMRSGTNQFHGSAYEYFANEALNAAPAFHTTIKPRERRNDYGFTFGGPVWLPKTYNGHNKTFFFFNFEQYRETQILSGFNTVPNAALRQGNFSGVFQYNIGVDPATGATAMADVIYDPNSNHTVNGVVERTPFPNNTIPPADLDPVALAIQKFFPQPSGPNANVALNNLALYYSNPRHSTVPSVKVDQQISAKSKISFFWSQTHFITPNNDGLPYPISTARGYNNNTNIGRINFDQTITPTVLFHAGIGILNLDYNESVDQYNVLSGGNGAPGIGLTGTNYPNAFPTISGLSGPYGGGPFELGAHTHADIDNIKPTGNISLTWVRGNHTYKFGGEVVVDGYINKNYTYAAPWIDFSANETSNPAFNGLPLSGLVTDTRLGRKALAGYAQDSWKVTHKLTLDYGLRYDFQTYLKADHGIQPDFSPSTLNPCDGCGDYLYGGTVFEATCHCDFSHNYPYAFGPRIGLAYQVIPKTVIRAGAGLSYSTTANNNFQSYTVSGDTSYSAPGFGYPAFQLANGLPNYVGTYPNFSPGVYPIGGIPSGALNFFDNNGGRPGRTLSWSFGVQREISRDIVVEANYVGNRGVWWQANTAVNDNALTYGILEAHGIDLNSSNPTVSAAAASLLNSQIGSPLAAQAGLYAPYSTFPLTESVAQALRPYPEYTSLLRLWNPDGDTWYEALQTKATKRVRYGLQFTAAFTWSKNEMNGAEGDANFLQVLPTAENDVFNRKIDKYLSGFDQPFVFQFSGIYRVPKPRFVQNKFVSQVLRDWQIGVLLNYASGLPIMAPTATNGLSFDLFQSTFDNIAPGVNPFLVNPNSNYDPNKTEFILNPAAWSATAAGKFGNAAAYYNNYRQQRSPVENMNFGRNFRIRERMNLQIRAEFTNIFNRVVFAEPVSFNIGSPQRPGINGTGSGFGYVNTTSQANSPRAGQLIARFTF